MEYLVRSLNPNRQELARILTSHKCLRECSIARWYQEMLYLQRKNTRISAAIVVSVTKKSTQDRTIYIHVVRKPCVLLWSKLVGNLNRYRTATGHLCEAMGVHGLIGRETLHKLLLGVIALEGRTFGVAIEEGMLGSLTAGRYTTIHVNANANVTFTSSQAR